MSLRFDPLAADVRTGVLSGRGKLPEVAYHLTVDEARSMAKRTRKVAA